MFACTCVKAAAAADIGEVAAERALIVGEEHKHAAASRGTSHLALLEGVIRSRVVDLLTHHVATRQRRWWLAAYLCAHTRPHSVRCWAGRKGS